MNVSICDLYSVVYRLASLGAGSTVNDVSLLASEARDLLDRGLSPFAVAGPVPSGADLALCRPTLADIVRRLADWRSGSGAFACIALQSSAREIVARIRA